MGQAKTLIVKFRSRTSAAARVKKVQALVGEDLEAVRPLFPGERAADLASLFEVVLKGSASLDRVLGSLVRDKQIEYAHPPAARRPL